MKILVAVASKHGSTYEIAEVIVREFEAAGLVADLREINENPSLVGYDAAVIGSAVYMGRWMSEAQNFIETHQEKLVELPVWLFSSGPLGDDLTEDEGEPQNLAQLMADTSAIGHKVFVGKLDENELGLREKIVVRMVKAPIGDFRDWDDIRDWTADVVDELMALPIV